MKKETDNLRYTARLPQNFNTNIGDKEILNQQSLPLLPDQENTINCYTDGSKTDDSTGYGFVITGTDLYLEGFDNLGKQATVFQAEVIAIQKAAEKLIQMQTFGYNIQIYVDSQAAIKSLQKFNTKNKLVLDCKKTLNKLADRNRNINIEWIPHVGHTGNENADTMAKRGTRVRMRNKAPPLSLCVIKEEIKQWEEKTHADLWRSKETIDDKPFCRQTRMFLPQPNPKLWKKIRNKSRRQIKILTQMITGHTVLQRHLHIMKIAEDPECEHCLDGDETVEHYICHCHAFSFARHHTFGAMYLHSDELKTLDLDILLQYIRMSKRFEM